MLIRPARRADEAVIAAIVERAYGVHVERIGMRPGPMDDDYGEQVRRGLVHVAEDGARDPEVVGLIVLVEGENRLVIETVALYTHELMSENLALYARLGYEEDERRRVEAFSRVFSRVFMSKRL